MSDETQIYYLKCKGEDAKRITIPADWKVTFGPIAPGTKGGDMNGRTGLALRLYESKEKQRACFMEVQEFRHMSIDVQEKVTKVEQQTAYRNTPEGKKRFNVEARVSSWRDANEDQEPSEEFTKLPSLDGGEDISYL